MIKDRRVAADTSLSIQSKVSGYHAGEVEVQTNRPAKNFANKFVFYRSMLFTRSIFPIKSSFRALFAFYRNTTENLFHFFLLPLQSNGKNLKFTSNLFILLSYQVHKAPVKGRKPLLVSSWYSPNALFVITQFSWCLDFPCVG